MFQMIISAMMLNLSFIFMQMSHPLSMGLMLLIQTMMTCLIIGFLTKTFWFSYILFLIFLGGMLVLFIYVTSLASNEMFIFSLNLFIITLLTFTTMVIIIFLLDKSSFTFFSNNNEMKLFNMSSFLPENSITLNKLYNFPTNLITLLLIIYLFITLIAIVKITNIFYGPLRPMN